MGHSAALVHEHDKIAIARHIAKHSAPVGLGTLGRAIGHLALKKIKDNKESRTVAPVKPFHFSSHLKGRFR